MARFIAEFPVLGVQVVKVESKTYAKIFVGEEPDRVTEQVSAVMAMEIREDMADEVFAAASNFRLGQKVRLHIETQRGGKQSTKNVVLHVEAVEQQPRQQQPGHASQPQSARPGEAAKA